MRTNIDQIKEILNKHLGHLKNAYNVKNIGIFGSVVREEARETSDVDVLVEFYEPLSLFKFIELEDYLSKILGKKVDLVTRNALKPAIKEDVLEKVVYV